MKKKNICIFTFAISKSGIIPLSNFVDILHPISNQLDLISVNDGYTYFQHDKRVHAYGILHKKGSNSFTRIGRYIYSQLKMAYLLAKIQKNVDIFLFTIGGDTLLLPIITAKLFRKKVVLAFAGSSTQTLKFANDKSFKYLGFVSKINLELFDKIIIYTASNIQDYNLQKYKPKIEIASKHFLDFNKFTVDKKLDEREDIVGYVGRFSEEKGIINFIRAIPLILEHKDIKFILIGDGQLREEIENYIDMENLSDAIKITGWIKHDELPNYLNDLKLVSLPSYTEGLPNLMLESMACGTPVLANSVGSIPDIIKDGETGFIMKNNSPECMAENVIRALEDPNIENIASNAKELVNDQFTYENAVENYRKIFNMI